MFEWVTLASLKNYLTLQKTKIGNKRAKEKQLTKWSITEVPWPFSTFINPSFAQMYFYARHHSVRLSLCCHLLHSKNMQCNTGRKVQPLLLSTSTSDVMGQHSKIQSLLSEQLLYSWSLTDIQLVVKMQKFLSPHNLSVVCCNYVQCLLMKQTVHNTAHTVKSKTQNLYKMSCRRPDL